MSGIKRAIRTTAVSQSQGTLPCLALEGSASEATSFQSKASVLPLLKGDANGTAYKGIRKRQTRLFLTLFNSPPTRRKSVARCMLGIYSHGKAAKDTPVYPWLISHVLTKRRTYASGGHEHWNSTWAATDDVDACPRPHQTKARQGTLALGNSLNVF